MRTVNSEEKGVWAYLGLFWQHEGYGSSAFRFADRGAKLGLESLDGRRDVGQDGRGDGGDNGAKSMEMDVATRGVELRRTRPCIESQGGWVGGGSG